MFRVVLCVRSCSRSYFLCVISICVCERALHGLLLASIRGRVWICLQSFVLLSANSVVCILLLFPCKKPLTCPSSRPPFCVVGKKPKPSQKPRRRHNSLFVVLFHLFKNGVASQDEEKRKFLPVLERRFFNRLRGICA